MVPLYKKFIYSLRWNTAEALIYQSVLLTHQLILFTVTDYATYGLIGSLFAGLYCLLTIANGGFDAALAPFFTQYIQSKQAFTIFFYRPLFWQVRISGLIACVAIGILAVLTALPFGLLFILGSIFISESLKKNLRAFLQLAFLAKQTALAEIVTIIIYTGLVWGYHAVTGNITLYIIFIPMLIISLIDSFWLSWCAYRFYQTLPANNQQLPSLTKNILRSRFYNWLNQVSHTLFSSNFLVPLIALHFGMQHAGVFKLIGNITTFITTIMQKTFGFASNAFFANSKHEELAVKQEIFARITLRLNSLLIGLIIFLTINYQTLISLKGIACTDINWAVVYLFMLLQISENFFIAHEKLFITQEKIDHLWWLYIAIIGSVWVLAHQHFLYISPLILLVIMLLLRLISFAWIVAMSKAWWNVHTNFTLSKIVIAAWVIIALLFRILAVYIG